MAENSPESAARTLRLLWRHQLGEAAGTRGPRKKLTVDQIVAGAIELADAEGLEACSMRKVAEKLGTSATSLYAYVPDRSSLIGLMVDEVVGNTGHPELQDSLRDRLRQIAEMLWAEYLRHPWLLDAQSHRPWIGPNISDRYEWQLRAVEGSGLNDLAMDHTVALLGTHAAANAEQAIIAKKLAEGSGISDQEWWDVNGPILEQVMPADVYPISGRVGSAVGMKYGAVTSHRAVFEYGLEIILDGVEAQINKSPSED
jgi:AcrR family transcriptional regulator